MSTFAPRELYFDIDGFIDFIGTYTSKRSGYEKLTGPMRLRATQQIADSRIPHTSHVPIDKRQRPHLSASDDHIVTCGTDMCPQSLKSREECFHCNTCGYEAYCSEMCRDNDADAHKTRCTGTASHAARRMHPDLAKSIDNFYRPYKKQLRRPMRKNYYLSSFTPDCVRDEEERRRVEGIDLWLSLQLLKNVYNSLPTADNGGGILCMKCNQPTPVTFGVVNAVICSNEDLSGDIDLESVMETIEVPDTIRLSFQGVDKDWGIQGRFLICCSPACHETHMCMSDPFGKFSLKSHPLTGDIRLDILYVGNVADDSAPESL